MSYENVQHSNEDKFYKVFKMVWPISLFLKHLKSTAQITVIISTDVSDK